ncbi:hypothetical protein FDUTEX481_07068 [Tolypothrix sp. PCC 7601]|nr:hypothetical protein FDUTEX481_07068 [Tolypothrix sp. PCC 7601]
MSGVSQETLLFDNYWWVSWITDVLGMRGMRGKKTNIKTSKSEISVSNFLLEL